MKIYKKEEIKDILNSSNRAIEKGIANAKKQLKNITQKNHLNSSFTKYKKCYIIII